MVNDVIFTIHVLVFSVHFKLKLNTCYRTSQKETPQQITPFATTFKIQPIWTTTQ